MEYKVHNKKPVHTHLQMRKIVLSVRISVENVGAHFRIESIRYILKARGMELGDVHFVYNVIFINATYNRM